MYSKSLELFGKKKSDLFVSESNGNSLDDSYKRMAYARMLFEQLYTIELKTPTSSFVDMKLNFEQMGWYCTRRNLYTVISSIPNVKTKTIHNPGWCDDYRINFNSKINYSRFKNNGTSRNPKTSKFTIFETEVKRKIAEAYGIDKPFNGSKFDPGDVVIEKDNQYLIHYIDFAAISDSILK